MFHYISKEKTNKQKKVLWGKKNMIYNFADPILFGVRVLPFSLFLMDSKKHPLANSKALPDNRQSLLGQRFCFSSLEMTLHTDPATEASERGIFCTKFL